MMRSEQLVAIVELKKRGGSEEEALDRLRADETGSHLGDFEVAQRAGGGSGPGAAGVDSDHDQRQGAAFGVRGAVPAGRVRTVWTSLHDGGFLTRPLFGIGWLTIW